MPGCEHLPGGGVSDLTIALTATTLERDLSVWFSSQVLCRTQYVSHCLQVRRKFSPATSVVLLLLLLREQRCGLSTHLNNIFLEVTLWQKKELLLLKYS